MNKNVDLKTKAKEYLLACRTLLPMELHFDEALDAEMTYQECLSSGKLAQALEAADQMGILSNAPIEYWWHLEMAAETLGLLREAKRFHEIQNT